MPANQVEQRKQEDPDDVDEVPVETADLDRAVIPGGDRPVPRPAQHDGHDAEADDHVQRVEAGHQEIEREKDLRVREILPLELKRWTGNVVFDERLEVLEALDAEKHAAQR